MLTDEVISVLAAISLVFVVWFGLCSEGLAKPSWALIG
jgi:hypothetical protein